MLIQSRSADDYGGTGVISKGGRGKEKKTKQEKGKEKKEGDPKSQFLKEGIGTGNKQETCNRAAVASA